MQNFVQPGHTISVTAPYALSSGDGCLVGTIFGVAHTAALISTAVELAMEGVFDLKKTSALEIAQGDLLYWDDTAKELNKTSSGTPVATAVAAAANPSATVRARLLTGYNAPIDATILQYKTVQIAAADIVATTAGKFGHAAGVPLVADPGAGKVVELVSAVMYTKYDTAAFTAGGNITINSNGGSALTGVVSAANSLGATADKINQFVPLAVAGNALTANKGLNLVAATGFTQPGTAAGYISLKLAYRVHTL